MHTKRKLPKWSLFSYLSTMSKAQTCTSVFLSNKHGYIISKDNRVSQLFICTAWHSAYPTATQLSHCELVWVAICTASKSQVLFHIYIHICNYSRVRWTCKVSLKQIFSFCIQGDHAFDKDNLPSISPSVPQYKNNSF